MSYTNSTTNYGLPQWIAADHPKFLTDINNAYATIDTQLKNANDNASTASDNATSALSIAGQAATTAESAATLAGQAAALAQSVNELVGTLNAKMGTTSISTIGDGTVTGAIETLDNRTDDAFIETTFTNSTLVEIAANRQEVVTVDTFRRPTGYNVVAILRVSPGNTEIGINDINITNSQVQLSLHNQTANARNVQPIVTILFAKSTLF